MKLKKTNYRRLLYLISTVIIGLIALAVSNARLLFYKEADKAERVYLSTHLKLDQDRAGYLFDANYRIQSDYLASHSNMIGQHATFINVCTNGCALLRGNEEILEACGFISRDRFKKYRVYFCNVKITLENDQPLTCEPINYQNFKKLCSLMIA